MIEGGTWGVGFAWDYSGARFRARLAFHRTPNPAHSRNFHASFSEKPRFARPGLLFLKGTSFFSEDSGGHSGTPVSPHPIKSLRPALLAVLSLPGLIHAESSFHLYAPSPSSKQLWILFAGPTDTGLELNVESKVDVGFSAPRDDIARASVGNGPKSIYHYSPRPEAREESASSAVSGKE
jgi:hypothetical protein